MPGSGFVGAAHRPGAVPLRPLRLGELFDGAFRVIRTNPRATVGTALIVAGFSWIVPLVVSGVLSSSATIAVPGGDNPATADGLALGLTIGTFLLGLLAQRIGGYLVTGVVAHVAHEAALGRRVTLSQAWAGIRGRRWRLIALPLVVGLGALVVYALVALLIVLVALLTSSAVAAVLIGLLLGLAVVVALVWVYVRLTYLAVPALVVEGLGIRAAFGRAVRLSRSQFWRILGIALLTALVAGLAGALLETPITTIGEALAVSSREHEVPILTITAALTSVISGTLVTPFTSAVAALQYLDQRMRKEAYDVELMTQAGVTGS